MDPWIRLAPPGAGMMAGYLVLENPGEQPLELVAVSSPAFSSVEVHRTEIVGGVARMIAEPDLTVPPGGRAVFEPGGRHLMLHGPARDLGEGDTVALAFEFADDARVEIQVPVRRRADGDDEGTDPHHGH
ncbi:MAG: copper chaperone PCu(A)C [Gammaproteobacteria bacterium]